MCHLIACHARDNLGTLLVQEGPRYFIIETCDNEGYCIAYRTAVTLQDAWEEFDTQKEMK